MLSIAQRLGRLHSVDERDGQFLLASRLNARSQRTKRLWKNVWVGDQKWTPHCVAFSWLHWLQDGPIKQPGTPPILSTGNLYHECQLVDEWPGTNYAGTSVRAGAKVLQKMGYIESYHWAFDIETLITAVLDVGPVVVGTNWYNAMNNPSKGFFVRPEGRLDGGHAYLIRGVHLKRGWFMCKNSWGEDWGKRGNFKIKFNFMEQLLAESGEACLAVEIKKEHGQTQTHNSLTV